MPQGGSRGRTRRVTPGGSEEFLRRLTLIALGQPFDPFRPCIVGHQPGHVRPSEQKAPFDDFDQSRQARNGLRIKSTKSGKARRFPLPSVALDVLLEHRRNQQNENHVKAPHKDLDLVFRDRNGDYYKPDQMSSRIADIVRRAGCPGIGLHSMRYTYASQMLSRGVPIPTVSNRLGHANPITLRLYAHALESDELIAATRWDDAFADTVKVRKMSDIRH